MVEVPYGEWRSEITADLFGKGNCKSICELQATDNGVFWIEQSSTSGQRELYFCREGTNERVQWAVGQSIQSSVHEYGGGSFMPLCDGSIVYTTVEGVYIQKSPNDFPTQLANSNNKLSRFADFTISDSYVFCVHENHKNIGDPENCLISINRNTKEKNIVASGADFYASPRLSPDGEKLVWMQWNHNNMPWDETSIHMARVLDNGTLGNEVIIKDGNGKNVNYYCPSWVSDTSLLLINDSTDFWNLYEIETELGFRETNIYPVNKEIGSPLWQLGDRPYAACTKSIVMNVGGQLMIRHGDIVREVGTPGYTVFSHLSITNNDSIYCIGQGPKKSSTVLRIDTAYKKDPSSITIIRESRNSRELDAMDISEPENISFDSNGIKVSAWFYRPKNHSFTGQVSTLPPVLVLGHYGPTAYASDAFDLKKQFFTSRGFAILDVNYRGSTGFGSSFRHMLKNQWGIVDRDDVINGTKAVIKRGLVDADKVCIMGSSAGGYLVLASIIQSDIFKAAVSIYGVADLIDLVKDTHKFEKGYDEVLIAKYPENEQVYMERSPINHIHKIKTPVAFLHGKEDAVVPVKQSVDMYEKLKKAGITTALMTFENEGHGFRGEHAIRESIEAAYYFMCKAINIEPSIQSAIEIENLRAHSK